MRIRRITTHSLAAIAEGALIALLVVGLMSGTALAGRGGKGGGGGGKPSGTSYTGSFSLVLVDSADNVPNYGETITFNASSNAPYYFVELDCSQNGTVVFRQSNGFYPAWPWSKDYVLQSSNWTGGAADCVAELYSSMSDGSNRKTLATMQIHVSS